MPDPLAAQQLAEMLRLLDRDGPDQHRLPAAVQLLDLLHDRGEFLAFGAENHVGMLDADERPVRRDDHDLELVDLVELDRLGVGRPGHAGELRVHPEVILEGDRGQSLVFLLDADLLLGLDRLMQTVAPAPPGHQPAGELVHDDHLAVLGDVVDVALEQDVRPKRLLKGVVQIHFRGIVQIVLFGQGDGARLLVEGVVRLPFQLRDDHVGAGIQIGRLLRRTRDDERRARLVDQDRVDLVHDREMMPALHHRLQRILHVVAQIIEPELVVGAVGEIGSVGRLAGGVIHVVLNRPDGETEKLVDRPHPGGIAARQVIVHRHDMDAPAAEGVERRRESGDQRLALARLHLGDLARVQHHSSDELHVEMPHRHGAPRRLARQRERLVQEVVRRGPALELLPQAQIALADLIVAEGAHLRLERVDRGDARLQPAQLPLVLGADDFPEDRVDQHGCGLGASVPLAGTLPWKALLVGSNPGIAAPGAAPPGPGCV